MAKKSTKNAINKLFPSNSKEGVSNPLKGNQKSNLPSAPQQDKPSEVNGLEEDVSTQIHRDKQVINLKGKFSDSEKRYKEALKQIEILQKEREVSFDLKNSLQTFSITPKLSSNTSEATAVLVASDWHVEEKVEKVTVNDRNEYTPDIAKRRGEQFFRNGLRLIDINSKDIRIDNIVLALLGDFITNELHEESVENNALRPSEAIMHAQNIIVSGIDFLLKNSKCNLVIPCHDGNHGRTTKKVHSAKEHGHSLENIMYQNMRMVYRKESRVNFIVAESYHSYIPIYDYLIRFHHGHAMSYGGGIGGITIPVNKAIAQWNRGLEKPPYLDVFGHFHQFFDGGNFIANGSMIGYNGYAVRIKAPFEDPKQAFFLIDKKRGKTVTAPIRFD